MDQENWEDILSPFFPVENVGTKTENNSFSGVVEMQNDSRISMMRDELMDNHLLEKLKPVVSETNHLVSYRLGNSCRRGKFWDIMDNVRSQVKGKKKREIRCWGITPYRYEKKRKKLGDGWNPDFEIGWMTQGHHRKTVQKVGGTFQSNTGRFWNENLDLAVCIRSTTDISESTYSPVIDESLDLDARGMREQLFQPNVVARDSVQRNKDVECSFSVLGSTIGPWSYKEQCADNGNLNWEYIVVVLEDCKRVLLALHSMHGKRWTMLDFHAYGRAIDHWGVTKERADDEIWNLVCSVLFFQEVKRISLAHWSLGTWWDSESPKGEFWTTRGLSQDNGWRAEVVILDSNYLHLILVPYERVLLARPLVRSKVERMADLQRNTLIIGLSDCKEKRAETGLLDIGFSTRVLPGNEIFLLAHWSVYRKIGRKKKNWWFTLILGAVKLNGWRAEHGIWYADNTEVLFDAREYILLVLLPEYLNDASSNRIASEEWCGGFSGSTEQWLDPNTLSSKCDENWPTEDINPDLDGTQNKCGLIGFKYLPI